MPGITIGGQSAPATHNFVVAVQGALQRQRPERVATREDALQLLAFAGAKIIVATRSGAWWKIRQLFLGIGSARAFSESDAQLFTSVALHVLGRVGLALADLRDDGVYCYLPRGGHVPASIK